MTTTTFDATCARCSVFVYREGALAAIGHDLRIDVQDFTVLVDAGAQSCSARLDVRSLRAAHAMTDGKELHGALSDADRSKIDGHIREVLQASRYPTIDLRSGRMDAVPGGFHVSAALTLHGVEKTIQLTATTRGDRIVAKHRVHQPDYGIRPFSAMLGALRIKPDVDVEIGIPRLT